MSTPPVSATNAVLQVTRANGVATLTLNRPRQFNALSAELLAALQQAVTELAADAAVRVVVIAGAGRAFCAGHDLKELGDATDPAFAARIFGGCSRLMESLIRLPQPVIARVHGPAFAAGCQLVAQCDLAVCATDATFATSGINYGLFCSTPAVPLARNVSRKRALEMLFTGEPIDAAQALADGLVNRVVPAAELDAAVAHLTQSILAKPARAIAEGKSLFYKQIEQGIADAYAVATTAMACEASTAEAHEGISAFVEKRPPRWTTN